MFDCVEFTQTHFLESPENFVFTLKPCLISLFNAKCLIKCVFGHLYLGNTLCSVKFIDLKLVDFELVSNGQVVVISN
jgi:hypothetical protein